MQNTESTSLAAFGLVTALIEELVRADVLKRDQLQAIYQKASDGLPSHGKYEAAKEMLSGVALAARSAGGSS